MEGQGGGRTKCTRSVQQLGFVRLSWTELELPVLNCTVQTDRRTARLPPSVSQLALIHAVPGRRNI